MLDRSAGILPAFVPCHPESEDAANNQPRAFRGGLRHPNRRTFCFPSFSFVFLCALCGEASTMFYIVSRYISHGYLFGTFSQLFVRWDTHFIPQKVYIF